MDKSIIMNITLEELEVISDSLDILKNEVGISVRCGNVSMQDVIDRIDLAIEKIEND